MIKNLFVGLLGASILFSCNENNFYDLLLKSSINDQNMNKTTPLHFNIKIARETPEGFVFVHDI